MLTLLNDQKERLKKLEHKAKKRNASDTANAKEKVEKLNDELSSSSSKTSSDNKSGIPVRVKSCYS